MSHTRREYKCRIPSVYKLLFLWWCCVLSWCIEKCWQKVFSMSVENNAEAYQTITLVQNGKYYINRVRPVLDCGRRRLLRGRMLLNKCRWHLARSTFMCNKICERSHFVFRGSKSVEISYFFKLDRFHMDVKMKINYLRDPTTYKRMG